MKLTDVSLRDRGRWHTTASAIISFWILAGLVSHFALEHWWISLHTFTLGAIATAIVVFTNHFTEALTRTAGEGYVGIARRVVVLQLGIVLMIAGQAMASVHRLFDAGATLALAVGVWHAVVIWRKLRRSMSSQFAVTVLFYLAAFGFFVVAIAIAVAADSGLGTYNAMIAAHSRAMIWGFAWLTVVGTIVTILPTLTLTRISLTAKARCFRALAAHCVGLVATMGLLMANFESAAGIAQLLTVVAAVMIIQPVLHSILIDNPNWSTASLSTVIGVLWMLGLCAADAVLMAAGAGARGITYSLTPIFLTGGLIQLILGVLHHLLPTLVGGGPRKVKAGRAAADTAGSARLLLLNLGACLLLIGSTAGYIMVAIAVVWHVGNLARALMMQRSTESSPLPSSSAKGLTLS